MEKHSSMLIEQLLAETVGDDSEKYRLGSAMLRRKLGFTSNRLTPEQEKLYREEQRKLWLAINNPQKLKDEYGIKEP